MELLLLLSRECNNQPSPSIATTGSGWQQERHCLNRPLCPCLVYHQIIACWLTCWLTTQPTIKVKKNNQLAMRESDKKGESGKVMAIGIRVVGDKEGEGDEAGDGVGNEGGVQ